MGIAAGALAMASALAFPLPSPVCETASGPGRAALLELYTSEGCSSCPPAEHWLSSIARREYAADRLIPLALHVDYWDYIGWKDGYAKPAFAARQREQNALARSATIYTPQAMLNGRDLRGWYDKAQFAAAVAAINRSPPGADIRLTLAPPTPESVEVSVSARTARQGNGALYVALYENGLATEVKGGENAGALLRHDFVVRAWLGPYPVDGRQPVAWQQKIALDPGWKIANMGVVSFVQSRATGEVLQALATSLCRRGD